MFFIFQKLRQFQFGDKREKLWASHSLLWDWKWKVTVRVYALEDGLLYIPMCVCSVLHSVLMLRTERKGKAYGEKEKRERERVHLKRKCWREPIPVRKRVMRWEEMRPSSFLSHFFFYILYILLKASILLGSRTFIPPSKWKLIQS